MVFDFWMWEDLEGFVSRFRSNCGRRWWRRSEESGVLVK